MARKTATGPKKLLGDLQKLLRHLEDDLRQRSEQVAAVQQRLKARWEEARKANRTTATYESWREEYVTQVAVAWVLACVFVRHMEDNSLVADVHLAGRGGRLQEAFEAHEAFFKRFPTHTDREYLQDVFRNVARLPAMDALLGAGHNPLWDADFDEDGKPLPPGPANLSLSGDGAKHLLEFWQQRDTGTGELLREFGPGATSERNGSHTGSGDGGTVLDTRFLGDLYQDLSEAARKRFALLQTPDFVEEFILDRTLEPAVQEFGLKGLRMIDPTCGSGHFLLGAFHRLFNHWRKVEPGTNLSVLAQNALDSVYGIDLNPFAVAIARYRLLVAAMGVCDIRQLKDAPDFTPQLASGDSLLHGARYDRFGQSLLPGETWVDWLPEANAVGDFEQATQMLNQQYHVVVGNPPYITDKDECHREVLRKVYTSCYMKFSLGVPFTERFFALAENETATHGAGYVGLITTNSFMKREFGKALIEKVLPELDLTHVLDTSGAYIPGHGTPTVILFGRNRHPSGATVRAALGIRGEPGTPDDPAQGHVWHSILKMLDTPGQQNEFLSIVDAPRETFHRHPWSMGGGGAGDLKEAIETASSKRLATMATSVGYSTIFGEDDLWVLAKESVHRYQMEGHVARLVIGESIRDYTEADLPFAVYPYTKLGGIPQDPLDDSIAKLFWPYRSTLRQRVIFGKTLEQAGRLWYEHMYHDRRKLGTPLSITFAFVSTHNNFVLDRGGKVFNRSAPVIKLPPNASENDHLLLLGLLNSSVACFWMKQVFHNKGATAKDGVLQDDPEKFRFEFDGTKMQQFPVPALSNSAREALLRVTRLLDDGGARLGSFSFKDEISGLLLHSAPDLKSALDAVIRKRTELRRRMVRWQEELDWLCYELYGLQPPGTKTASLAHSEQVANLAGLDEGVRPYRFKSAATYQTSDALLHLRWEAIQKDDTLALLESPEYKRRWFRSAGAYDANNLDDSLILERSIREWLLDRLETPRHWPDPAVISCAQLGDAVRRDAEFMRVAALYKGGEDFDVTSLVTELVLSEGVPYLPRLRYTPSGLQKRKQWEDTWALQRREDAGEKVGTIPVPPKYTNTDFQRGEYWRLRGKLDVAKERFILYSGAERESDPTPVVGWAGWDHLQQAQALATYYLQCKDQEGWSPERLRPLLEGLYDLVPWLLQWHNDVDPSTGERLGTFYQGFVEEQARSLGGNPGQLAASWRTPR